MYELDDSAAAIGVFLFTIFMVILFWIATPAHSQEAPAGPPCAPWRDIHSMLEKQFGETTTAGGIIGSCILIATGQAVFQHGPQHGVEHGDCHLGSFSSAAMVSRSACLRPRG